MVPMLSSGSTSVIIRFDPLTKQTALSATEDLGGGWDYEITCHEEGGL